jgi:hypothetical protein
MEALMSAASDDLRRARPRSDDWSAHESFAHVRACADVWGGHITTILSDSPASIPAGDPRAWAVDHGYTDADFAESFAAYAGRRVALLAVLRALAGGGWARSAVVVGSARRTERSVRWHAEHIVRHEDQHVLQIRRTLRAVARAG